ncbi:hypothetical protein QVD17_19683 [Tagetes erecta]|uniref:Uncharacterized protein n=1 Tax=Tagetes erecta TaxID=13708 RepID=A0AAD8NXF2_TARER|nr:hypothetical protein QVD17_19683 [Tagetes erecta]
MYYTSLVLIICVLLYMICLVCRHGFIFRNKISKSLSKMLSALETAVQLQQYKHASDIGPSYIMSSSNVYSQNMRKVGGFMRAIHVTISVYASSSSSFLPSDDRLLLCWFRVSVDWDGDFLLLC